MKIKNLSETSDMMSSADYQERFKAEYYQLKIRLDKLKIMLDKWHTIDVQYSTEYMSEQEIAECYKNHLGFVPSCPYDLLSAQASTMETYLTILKRRAKLEKIKL